MRFEDIARCARKPFRPSKPETLEQWRHWLAHHHDAESEVWLIFPKLHTGRTSITYADALDEALCFGWVDSLVKRLDDARYARKFTSRRLGGKWSSANRTRYARLAASGRLTPAGLNRPPTDHSGDAPRPSPSKLPSYIDKELSCHPQARTFFESYTGSMLLCPVRDCRLALVREGRRLLCVRGHSFDVARSGYINLLQPQERRSKQPGDTAAALVARRRLHDAGVTQPLLRGIAEIIAGSPNDVVLDAGCGEGFYLGGLAREIGFQGHGIDISIAAVDSAARRYPQCEWVVANADRVVPYADRSFTLVMTITGRMNPGEFRRVLSDDGRLLVALPSPDDLIELRGVGRDRVARTIAAFSPGFTLADRRRASTTAELDAAAVHDVLHSIYRPLRPEPATAMRVTFSLDLLLFRTATPRQA